MQFKKFVGCVVSALCIFTNTAFANTVITNENDNQNYISYGSDFYNPYTPNENYEQAFEDLKNGCVVPLVDLIVPTTYDDNESISPFSDDNTDYVATFGYDTLNVKEKKVYNQIVNNKDIYADGTSVIVVENCPPTALTNTSVSNAINALDYDRPDIYWIEFSKQCVYSDGYNLYISSITEEISENNPVKFPTYYDNYYKTGLDDATSEDILSYSNQIEEISDEAIKTFDLKDKYSAVKSINKWIVGKCDYNAYISEQYHNNVSLDELYSENSIPWTILSVFLYSDDDEVKNDPVCEGYARTMQYFCNKLSIPCVLIASTNHMWNYILMEDGLWYAVDSTWNDPVVGGSYDNYGEKYLLVGSNTVVNSSTFKSTHSEYQSAMVYTFPTLSPEKYVYDPEEEHLAVSVTEESTTETTTLSNISGDTDNNGEIDNKDVAYLLKYLSGSITENQFLANYNYADADADNNGNLNMLDAISILNKMKEIILNDCSLINDENSPWREKTISAGSIEISGYVSTLSSEGGTTLTFSPNKSGTLTIYIYMPTNSANYIDIAQVTFDGDYVLYTQSNTTQMQTININGATAGQEFKIIFHRTVETTSTSDYAFVGGFEITD